MAVERVPPLSIGASVGGASLDASSWGGAVMAIARRVKALRQSVETPLNVNVVFDISGEVVGVDYEGIRTGTYSKSKAAVMVQVALPADFPSNADEVLMQELHRAVEVAEEFARRKGLTDEAGLAGLRAIVDAAAQA